MNELPVSYVRLLSRLERQEARLMRDGLPLPRVETGLEGRIPPKARQALEAAFFRAFQTLFGPGGARLVEKTIPLERLGLEQRLWEGELTTGEERALLRQMERGRRRSQAGQVLAAGAEGEVQAHDGGGRS